MKIKNVSGRDVTVPWLGDRLVLDEQEVPVPEGSVFAYTQQEQTWVPADDEAQAEHDEGLAGCAVALMVQGRFGELLVKTEAARALVKVVKDPETPVGIVVQILAAEKLEAEPRTSVLAAAEKRLDPDGAPDPEPAPTEPTITYESGAAETGDAS